MAYRLGQNQGKEAEPTKKVVQLDTPMSDVDKIKAFLKWLDEARGINLTTEWEDENIEGEWVTGTSEIGLNEIDRLYDHYLEETGDVSEA